MRAYERLLRYCTFPTASNHNSESSPSTKEQLVLANALVEELQNLGVKNARVDADGYVYGTIPATTDASIDPVGFIAHMDVVDDVPCAPIHPRLVPYEGGVVTLHEELGITLDPKEFPDMNRLVGKTLLVTDGTTLLGGDDKAGIAEIMTMVEYFHLHPEEKHGTIQIAFTPDEEIGRGTDHFDVKGFGASFAYTVDGGAFGELSFENFNAASATVRVQGANIHPGSAKNKMVNAMLLAMEFDRLLPPQERPEHTEGREGFYHLIEMNGTVEEATLEYLLRDHDLDRLREREQLVREAADFLNTRYPGRVSVEVEEHYYNMIEQIRPYPKLMEAASNAVRKAGGEPRELAVRGGTDGARLSFMGIPCPNLCTGGYNCHGKKEFACVEEMEACTEVLIEIVREFAKGEMA